MRRLEAHDGEIAAIKVNVGRLEQHQLDLSQGVTRIEQDIKELSAAFMGRFDRLNELLLGFAK